MCSLINTSLLGSLVFFPNLGHYESRRFCVKVSVLKEGSVDCTAFCSFFGFVIILNRLFITVYQVFYILNSTVIIRIGAFNVLLASIEYSARNFSFLIVIILSRGAGIYCSVKCVFAVLLTVCTVEQYVIKENLFSDTVLACFKARISRICRTARKLKACGHNILDSLIAVFTVYNRIFARTDFALIDICSSGRIGCCLLTVSRVNTRCNHQTAINI